MFLLGGFHVWGAFLSVFTCLFVWVSSFLSPAPPDFSSLHEALTPVPLAAGGHPPSPRLVLMREWGGQAPPSPGSGIGWQRLEQEGSEERYFC